MKHNVKRKPTSFFVTSPLPCPYLEQQTERRLVAELKGPNAKSLNEGLSKLGFRRSHNLVYLPICDNCSACLAVRNVVKDFCPSKSQKRILNKNRNVKVIETPPAANYQRFSLFSRYQQYRHRGSDMEMMDYFDFQSLIEETPVDTTLYDFFDEDETLIGGCLVDTMSDGLSAVYSYFEPDYKSRSLGSYIILWLIEKTIQCNLEYCYLGYWIEGSAKMSYKDKFQPLEYFMNDQWVQSTN